MPLQQLQLIHAYLKIAKVEFVYMPHTMVFILNNFFFAKLVPISKQVTNIYHQHVCSRLFFLKQKYSHGGVSILSYDHTYIGALQSIRAFLK